MATADLEIWVGRESTISFRDINAIGSVAVAGANQVNLGVDIFLPRNILLTVTNGDPFRTGLWPEHEERKSKGCGDIEDADWEDADCHHSS